MKKASTAVTMQSRNISQQKLTIGLDPGDRNSWCCVVDEAGQIQLEQRGHFTQNPRSGAAHFCFRKTYQRNRPPEPWRDSKAGHHCCLSQKTFLTSNSL